MSIEELAKDALKAIVPEFDRPYVLFGHSMGSLVAFELCRALKREKYPLPLLVVLSSSSPKPCDSIMQCSDVVKTLCEQGWWMGDKTSATPALLSDIELYKKYVPTKIVDFSSPCLLVTAEDDKAVSKLELKNEWSRYIKVTDDLVVMPSPANHFYPLEQTESTVNLIRSKIRTLFSSRPISVLSGPSFPSTCSLSLSLFPISRNPLQLQTQKAHMTCKTKRSIRSF